MTKIEWTDLTWNPIAGCDLVSPGCTNCYAMRQAHRLASNPKTPHYAGTTRAVNGKPVWTGKIGIAPDKVLTAPLRRRKPTRYFVNSMSDLFHPGVPDDVIDRTLAVMALSPQHTFQVLTKRTDRVLTYFSHVNAHGETRHEIIERKARFFIEDADAWMTECWPLPNVWLGTSVEDQRRADERIPELLRTPAAVRFLSCEPLLGPVDLCTVDHGHAPALSYLDWVIVGGESGPGARPMHPDWARSLRDQCQAAGVPFFFKQWGAWAPWDDDNWSLPAGADDVEAHEKARTIDGVEFLRVGKRAAGRLLDGRTWDEVPG